MPTTGTTAAAAGAIWDTTGVGQNVTIGGTGTLTLAGNLTGGAGGTGPGSTPLASTAILLDDTANNSLTITAPVTLTASTSFVVNNTGTLTLSTGALTLGSANTLTLGGVAGSNIIISSSIAGASTGAVTDSSAGTVTLSGTNTGTGALTITGGGLLKATSSAITNNSIVFSGSGGTLQATNGISDAKAVTLTSAGTFDTNGNSSTLTGAIGGAGVFTVANSSATTGTLTLSGTAVNTFSGGLTLTDAGGTNTILVDANTGTKTLGTGLVTMANSTEIDLGNNSPTVLGLSTSGTGSGVKITNASGTAGAPVLTLSNAPSSTFGGVISNGTATSLGLTLTSGTQTLTGANTYSGVTTVGSTGVLITAGTNSSAGATTLNSGSTLQLDSASDGGLASGTLTINGGTLQSIFGSATTISNAVTFSGSVTPATISGSQSITLTGGVAPSASATLNNSISTGSLTISTGAVNIDGTVTGTAQTMTLSGTGNTLVSSLIQDYSGGVGTAKGVLIITNTGTTTLTAADTFGGGLTVSGGTVNLNNTVANSNITVNAATLNLGAASVLSSKVLTAANASTVITENTANAISGTSALIVNNGAVTLSLANNYTGTTTLSGGTLNLTATGAINGSSINITGGTLAESSAGSIAGTGTITVSGGATTFGGANTYTGGTTIGTGTVTVTGSMGATSTIVNSGGLLNLNAANAYTASTVRNNGGTITENTVNAISGSTAVNLTGGLTTLSVANNYSGGTTISTGTLTIGDANAMGGTGTGAVLNFNGGTVVTSTALNIATPVLLGTSATTAVGTIGSTSAGLTFSGNFTDNGASHTLTVNSSSPFALTGGNLYLSETSSNRVLTINGSDNITIGDLISNYSGQTGVSGAGTLVYSGTGTLTITNSANTYLGGTTISNGTVNVASLSNGTETPNINAIAAVGQTTIVVGSNFGLVPGEIIISSGIPTGDTIKSISGNTITLNVATTGTTSATTASTMYMPSSLGNVVGTANNLVFDGGTLQYTGTTTQSTDRNFQVTSNGATLDASGTGAGSLTLTGGGFAVSGSTPTNFNLKGSGTGTYSGALDNFAGFSSTGLVKTGTGTWTVSGNSTFTGGTTISGGLLNVGTFANGLLPSSLGSSSNAASNLVLDGGTLQYTGTTTQSTNRNYTVTANNGTIDASGTGLGGLTIGGNLTASGTTGPETLTLTGSGTSAAAGTLSGSISDGSNPTAVSKTGSGTWILSGASNYSGGTTIGAGTVTATSGSALGVGAVSVSGTGTGLNYIAATNTPLSLGSTLGIGASTVIGTSIGSGPSSTAIAAAGVVTAASPYTVNIYSAGGTSAATSGTYNLITGAAGSTFTGASVGFVYNDTNFVLGSLTPTATALQETITGTTTLSGTVYWKGGLTGATNVWAASNGTTASNWSTNIGGTGATPLVPNANDIVQISVTSPTTGPTATVLGANMSIGGLVITDTTNGLGLVADGNTLSIGSSGILIGNSAGSLSIPASTIGSNVALSAAQTWTNDNKTANTFTVSGPVALAGNNLTVVNSNFVSNNQTTISGGITGTGSLTLQANNSNITTGITINNANNAGTITNSGGAGLVTVNGVGVNVTGITQSSTTATSVLNISGGTNVDDFYNYTGSLTAGGSGTLKTSNAFYTLSPVTIGSGASFSPSGTTAVSAILGNAGTITPGSLTVNYVGQTTDNFSSGTISALGSTLALSFKLDGSGNFTLPVFSATTVTQSNQFQGNGSGILTTPGINESSTGSVGQITINNPHTVVQITGNNGLVLGGAGITARSGSLLIKPSALSDTTNTATVSGLIGTGSTITYSSGTIILDGSTNAGVAVTLGNSANTVSVFNRGNAPGTLTLLDTAGLGDFAFGDNSLVVANAASKPILTNGLAGGNASSGLVGGPTIFASDSDANQTGDFTTYNGSGTNDTHGFQAASHGPSAGAGDGVYTNVNNFTSTGTTSVVDITPALASPLTISTGTTTAYALRITGASGVTASPTSTAQLTDSSVLDLGGTANTAVAGLVLNGGTIGGNGTLSVGAGELVVYTSLANGTIQPVILSTNAGIANDFDGNLTKTGPGTLFLTATAAQDFHGDTGIITLNQGALDGGTWNGVNSTSLAGNGIRFQGGVIEGNGLFARVGTGAGSQQPGGNAFTFSANGGGFAAYGTGATGSAANNLTVTLNSGSNLVWGGDSLSTTSSGAYTVASNVFFMADINETNNATGEATLLFGSNVSNGTVTLTNSLSLGLTTDDYYREINVAVGTGTDSAVIAGAIVDTAATTGAGANAGVTIQGVGTHGILKDGPGTLVLSGSNSYNGLTQVTNGSLFINGITGTTNGGVTGAAVGQGSYTVAPSATTSQITITGGASTFVTSAQYEYYNAATGTQTLVNGARLGGNGAIGLAPNQTLSFTGTTNPNASNALVPAVFEPGVTTSNGIENVGSLTIGTAGNGNSVSLGAMSQYDVFMSATSAGTAASEAIINGSLAITLGASSGTSSNLNFNLEQTASGFATGDISTTPYTIAAFTPGSLTGAFFGDPNGSTVTSDGVNFIINYNNSVGTITLTAQAAANAYFNGTSTNTNLIGTFDTVVNATPATAVNAAAESTTNVFFSANRNSTLTSASLTAPLSVNSLNFGTGTGTNSGITISSTNNTTNNLTITGANVNGNASNNGITITGGGTDTISAPVVLAGQQTWNTDTGSQLIVSGPVSGSPTVTSGTALTTAGTGSVYLTSANTYGGGTTVNGGTLYVNGGTTGASPTSGTGTGPVNVSSGGILAGNGNIIASGTGITVASGGSIASGTPAQITGSTIAPLGGLTVTNSPVTLNSANLTFQLGSGTTPGTAINRTDFTTPNNNTTYLTLAGSASINFAGSSSISLVDLTNGALQMSQGTPYLLVVDSLGLNTAYGSLVTMTGSGATAVYSIDGNGYVVGVAVGGYLGGTGVNGINSTNFSAIAINEYGPGGVSPLNANDNYFDPVLYLNNGDLEVVPEPGTWALMLGGLGVLAFILRQKRMKDRS